VGEVKYGIGARVRVNVPGDPHHGREGEVGERMILRPENDRYPSALVVFHEFQSRWYHDHELEAVDVQETE
jgi:hypothetical protein